MDAKEPLHRDGAPRVPGMKGASTANDGSDDDDDDIVNVDMFQEPEGPSAFPMSETTSSETLYTLILTRSMC